MGEIVAYQGVMRDVTAKKLAEEALHESEAKYRNLFENSRDAISIGTPDGTYIEANKAWFELMGFTPEEAVGLHWRDVYADPNDRRSFQEEMERFGNVQDYELRVRTKTGEERCLLVSSTARRDLKGKVIEYQNILPM